jgi:serine/threonine protein kinase
MSNNQALASPPKWWQQVITHLNDGKASSSFSLGDWEISTPPLGEGGFGATFLGRKKLRFDSEFVYRQAAVKMLNPKYTQARQGGFKAEVEALATVDSRFIAQLVDGGIEKGISWIATEYIPGATLQEQIRSVKKLGVSEIINLTEDCLRGLSAAHDSALLHLDIKPANIMYSKSDESYSIVDLGISKIQRHVLLVESGFAGTFFYSAPEAFERQFSRASDIFSLGTTLFYAATGVNPWVSALKKRNLEPSAENYLQVLNKGNPDYDLLPKEMPFLREIIEPMLSIEAQKRPPARVILSHLSSLRFGLERIAKSTLKISHKTGFEELFKSWREFEQKLSNVLKSRPLDEFKLDIQTEQDLEVWFRIEERDESWIITCPGAKAAPNLNSMGWNVLKGSYFLEKRISKLAPVDEIAAVITQALESGFGLDITTMVVA